MALHRLLYVNFVGPLQENEYVRFLCHNKGRCCNVTCLDKQRYSLYSGGPNSKLLLPPTGMPFSETSLFVNFL